MASKLLQFFLMLADTIMPLLSFLNIVNIEEMAVNYSKIKKRTYQVSVELIFCYEFFLLILHANLGHVSVVSWNLAGKELHYVLLLYSCSRVDWLFSYPLCLFGATYSRLL